MLAVGKVNPSKAKANIPMVTRLLFFPNLNVSFLFPKCVSLLPHYNYSSSTQRRERERESKTFLTWKKKESCVRPSL